MNAETLQLKDAQKWLLLAVGSLLLGGLLSLVLVVGRVPGVNEIITDPYFVKRCLVIHVTLTLSCWFFSFIACLFYLLPGPTNSPRLYHLAVLGILIFCMGGFAPSAEPILSNYIPVIHHPMFLLGVGLFLLSIAASLVSRRLWAPLQGISEATNGLVSRDAALGIKISVIYYLLSIGVLAVSVATTPWEGALSSYYEILFWGAGHTFQFANIAALMSVWLILYRRMSGRSLLQGHLHWLAYLPLLVPLTLIPFTLWGGTQNAAYYSGFRWMMQWATWPAPSFLVLVFAYRFFTVNETKLNGRELEFIGIVFSASLLLLGFALGAQIRESNTLIPAHYHATIGSVSLAFMSLTYVLFSKMGWQSKSALLDAWKARQVLIFGTGQFTFAVGFAYAGLHGLGRKLYGHEQLLNQTEQYVGLTVMGIGGLMAIVGGALFFMVLYKSGHLSISFNFKRRTFPSGTS